MQARSKEGGRIAPLMKSLERRTGFGWRTWGVALGSVFAVACATDATGPGPEEVASVVVAPLGGVWGGQMNVGDTITLEARALGSDGGTLPGRPTEWTSSDSAVATVSTGGLLRATGTGVARVTAKVSGVSGSTMVTVSSVPSRPVAEVIVQPQAAVLRVGDQRQFSARALDADGNELEGLAVTWINDSPEVIGLTETGSVTGLKAGYGQVTARIMGVSSSVGLTVTGSEPGAASLILSPEGGALLAGQQASVRAVLLTAAGDTLPDPVVGWSVEEGTAASVTPTPAPGFAVITALEPGTARIVARAAGLEARAAITVSPGQAVGSMEMRPPTLLVEVGVSVTLGVHAWTLDGSFFADVAASWVSSDPSIAEASGVGPTGTLRAHRAGTVEITAAAGGVSVRSVITVVPPGPVGHVIVVPSEAGVWEGSLYRLQARALYGSGGDLPGQPILWEVEDTSVATIEADGLMLTRAPGTTRVFARSAGKVGVANIRVYANPSDRMVFDLDPTRGPDGELRPVVSLSDTLWTGPDGIQRVAHRFLMGGTLEVELGVGSAWSQTLLVETVVVLPDGPKRVATDTRTDRGSWTFGFPDPWHLSFYSQEKPGYSFEGWMPEAGRLRVTQSVTGTTVRGYLWRLR